MPLHPALLIILGGLGAASGGTSADAVQMGTPLRVDGRSEGTPQPETREDEEQGTMEEEQPAASEEAQPSATQTSRNCFSGSPLGVVVFNFSFCYRFITVNISRSVRVDVHVCVCVCDEKSCFTTPPKKGETAGLQGHSQS